MAQPADKFFGDDDIVTLSSDDEDAPPEPTRSSTVNGNRGDIRSFLGSVSHGAPPALNLLSASPSKRTMTNGHNGSSTSPMKPKVDSGEAGGSKKSSGKDVEVFTVDDDSDYEIEYTDATDSVVVEGAQAIEDDSDDDIQVIDDGGYPKPKKRSSQESRTAEVNLSHPLINMNIISSSGRSTASQNNAVKIDADNDSSSLSDSVEEISDDKDEAVVEEVDDEQTEGSIVSTTTSVAAGPSTTDNYAELSRVTLQRFVNEFCARKPRGATQKDIEKAKGKVWEAYDKIKHYSRPIHDRLREDIEAATNVIRCTAGLHWKTLKNLLDAMKPTNVCHLGDISEAEWNKTKEQSKLNLRIKYEKELAKIQKKIRKLEETDWEWTDVDNDHNSPYLLADRYKAMLIKNYYILCDLSKCNRFTGRPTQTRINLQRHNAGTNYPAVDAEVEKFINKKGFLFAPDYTDILNIIIKVNKSCGLGFSQDEINKTAQRLFENVIKIIKKRREKDFKLTMLAHLPKTGKVKLSEPEASPKPLENVEEDEDISDESLVDPAELDAELQAKLEANDKMRRSEAEVIEKFCKLAEGQQADIVEDEGANDSPPPSDNEEEESDNDEDSGEDNEKVDNDHQSHELFEEEDEVPETVGGGWSGNMTQAELDEDSNSNEGKLTNTESESDTNAEPAEENGETSKENGNSKELVVPAECVTCAEVEATPMETETETAATVLEEPSKEVDADDDDIQPPPAKRLRADENCNEKESSEAVVPEIAAQSEESAPPTA